MGLGLLGALKGHSESPVPSLELGSGLAATRMLGIPPLLSLLPLAAAGTLLISVFPALGLIAFNEKWP